MASNSKWRGHDTVYWESTGEWYYKDTMELVSENPTRVCGHCGVHTDGEEDACLGKLPGVMNACCGHGDVATSYIQFEGGLTVRGFVLQEEKNNAD